jgi:hypothetical protein
MQNAIPCRIVYSEQRFAVPLIYGQFHMRKRERAAEQAHDHELEMTKKQPAADPSLSSSTSSSCSAAAAAAPSHLAASAFDFGSDVKKPRVSARKMRQIAEERLRNIQTHVWEDSKMSAALFDRRRAAPVPAVVSEDEDSEGEGEGEGEGGTLATDPTAPASSSSASASSSLSSHARRKYAHPLDRNQEEVVLWTYDEVYGSITEEARRTLNVPSDTMKRAAWRHIMAMEHTVLNMTVKEKRKIYLLMRHLTGGIQNPDVSEQRACEAMTKADHLLTETGMTLGQLSVFHILLTRTQYVKTKDLEELVRESEVFVPEMQQTPVTISQEQPQ